MKKLYILAGFALLALASCTKIEENIPAEPQGQQVTLIANNAVWGETKTAYTAGTGVGLTGDEPILLRYTDTAGAAKSLLVTPTSGHYTFTMPTDADCSVKWNAILPGSATVIGGNGSNLQLAAVQNPKANSFDPAFDYLVAEPFEVTSDATEVTINSFKRMFIPLRVNITGLAATDKIYSATIHFDQDPGTSGLTALTGLFYVKYDEDYSVAGRNGLEAKARGNAVSAVYADGLQALNGSWPVWFVINPSAIAAGSTITVTVSTADRTYTRTISAGDTAFNFSSEKLNTFSVNATEEGGIEGEESLTQNFTGIALGGSKSLTASNGSACTWPATGAKWTKNDGLVLSAMNLNNGSFTFPTISGKKIVKARIFTHAASYCKGGAAASLTLLDGETALATYDFNLCAGTNATSLYTTGGVQEITLPEGKESLSGLSMKGTTNLVLVSAITLFTADGGSDDPVIEEATGSDYWTEFQNGKKITIDGVAYHKSTHPDYELLTLSASTAVSAFQKDKIIFVDDSEYPAGFISTAHIKFNNNAVIIGRYKNHQPKIWATANGTSYRQLQVKGTMVFKNVDLYAQNGSGGFVNSDMTTTGNSLVFSDCTVHSEGAIIRETSPSVTFENVVFDNCVIYTPIKTGMYVVTQVDAAAGMKRFVVNNCVYHTAGTYNATAGDYSGTPGVPVTGVLCNTVGTNFLPTNMVIEFTNNTVYNFGGGGNLFYANVLAGVHIDNNVFASSALAQKAAIISIKQPAGLFTVASTISNNYCWDGGNTYTWSHGLPGSIVNCTKTNPAVQVTSCPFTSTDTTTGYFPVDASVAPNAGASYSTKTWKTW